MSGSENAEVLAALRRIEHDALVRWVAQRSWFNADARTIAQLSISDAIAIVGQVVESALAMVDVTFANSAETKRYLVPFAFTSGEQANALTAATIDSKVYSVVQSESETSVPEALLTWIADNADDATCFGLVHGAGGPSVISDELMDYDVEPVIGPQRNTTYAVGDRFVLKMLRRLAPGVHPEAEMLSFLGNAGFRWSPRLAGVVMYQRTDDPATTTLLSVLADFVPNRGSANGSSKMRSIGEITAELHSALASDDTSAEFAPRAVTKADESEIGASIASYLNSLESTVKQANSSELDRPNSGLVALLDRYDGVRSAVDSATARLLNSCMKIRIHGDYNLSQLLTVDDGFMIVDFEGDPEQSLTERRKQSLVLRDLATMASSIEEVVEEPLVARSEFLAGYLDRIGSVKVKLVPSSIDGLDQCVAIFQLKTAISALLNEIENHSDALPRAIENVGRVYARVMRLNP